MALFDYAAEEVLAKVVYYGPDRSGKSTNLQQVYDKLGPSNRGEVAVVTTESGTIRVFDFLPADMGRVRGLRMRVQLCAPEGPASSPAALRAVLKGADAVVFVADSRAEALDSDEQS